MKETTNEDVEKSVNKILAELSHDYEQMTNKEKELYQEEILKESPDKLAESQIKIMSYSIIASQLKNIIES